MTDTLLNAYLPLLLWPGLGFLIIRVLPETIPRILGRGLYWVGIPLEVFALAHRTDFSDRVGLTPLITIAILVAGLGLAGLTLRGITAWAKAQVPIASTEDSAAFSDPPDQDLPASDRPDPLPTALSSFDYWLNPARRGSFFLSAMIANTGFVGLAVAPIFVSDRYLSWIVFYSITHNVVGTYGIGVLIASYFGRSGQVRLGWTQVRDVLTVPSLWAFVVGMATRSLPFPGYGESALQLSVWVVIPVALTLMGMRLGQLNGWSSLRWAIAPTVLKVILIPGLVGLAMTALGLPPEPRLAMVLMAGMPSAFAGLILAEEYDLDRELIASSIVLTTGLLFLTIPVWLLLFGA